MKFTWKQGVMLFVVLSAVVAAVIAWRAFGLELAADAELKSARRDEAVKVFDALRHDRKQLAQVYWSNGQYKQWFDHARYERIVRVEILTDDVTKMRILAAARTSEGRDYQFRLEPAGWKLHLIGARNN